MKKSTSAALDIQKVTLLLCVPLLLAGCGMGSGGPSSHEVKKALAEATYVYEVDTAKFTSTPSSYENLVQHKNHYIHKYEGNLHDVDCSKSSHNVYNCSLKGLDNKVLTATMQKYGNVWKLLKTS